MSTAQTPPGAAPGLARHAYNRLAFGPTAADSAAFGAFDLTAYVDAQLSPEALDDSACEAAINALSRTDSGNVQIPPLDCALQAINDYKDASEAAGGYAAENLQHMLWTATYARALLSHRQLSELMVDFWSNHFQTTAQNIAKYWEDHHVIRRHALGNFRDLLGASAKSPSMLSFLSNEYSDGANPNENYARELMELHTLGSNSFVPGAGYRTQPNYNERDVATGAQILSGWSTRNSPDGQFAFSGGRSWPTHHWPEKTMWLGNESGYYFPYGGIEQGEQLLDILASHPSTAWHIAWKLCRRFVSDNPDQFCPDTVAAGAQAFMATDGDIRATLRAILLHPKFGQSWGEKVKRPFEFLISTLRAMGATSMINLLPSRRWQPLGSHDFSQMIELQGQKLFDFGAPTGYADFAAVWWNTNQVFGRMSMANALVNVYFGEYDTYVNNSLSAPDAAQSAAIHALIGGPGRGASAVVDTLIDRFAGRPIDPADRVALINYLGGGNAALPVDSSVRALRPVIGLIAASPYAQWR